MYLKIFFLSQIAILKKNKTPIQTQQLFKPFSTEQEDTLYSND